MRVAMSHAQMDRIDCRELAHGQAYSCSDVYGECRDNEQAPACESVGMANQKETLKLVKIWCQRKLKEKLYTEERYSTGLYELTMMEN